MPPGTGFFAAVSRHFPKPPGIRQYPGVSTLKPGSARKRRCKNRMQTVRRNPPAKNESSSYRASPAAATAAQRRNRLT